MSLSSGATASIGSIEPPTFGAQRALLRRFFKQPLGVLGLIVLLFLGVLTAIGPDLVSHDPYALGTERLAPPSREHLAGTDQLGRDVMTRVVYGVRPSMVVAFGAVLISVAAGTFIGTVSAYVAGTLDLVRSG